MKIVYATLWLFAIFISSCIIESKNPIKIDELDLKHRGYGKVLFYKSFSNATTNESIQIRTENDSENSIIVYEGYDVLLGSKVTNNSIELILEDTSGTKIKIDTVSILIDSIFRY